MLRRQRPKVANVFFEFCISASPDSCAAIGIGQRFLAQKYDITSLPSSRSLALLGCSRNLFLGRLQIIRYNFCRSVLYSRWESVLLNRPMMELSVRLGVRLVLSAVRVEMVSRNRDKLDALCDVNDDWATPPERHLSSEEFVALLVRHESRVRCFIMSLTLPSSEVDDVFQNTCIVALRKLGTFSYQEATPDTSFVRWLCTIARFEVLQLYRTKRTSRLTFDSDLIEKLADMQLRDVDSLRERAELLTGCIEKLSDKEQGLLLMRYGKGQPVSAIAHQVGLSANGVYKALDRIRTRLLACIQFRLGASGSQ